MGDIETVAPELVKLNGGRRLDCVLDVTGNPAVIPHALKLVRMRGRYIVLGSPRGISHVDFHDDIHFGVNVLGAQWNTYPQAESPQAPWTAGRNGQIYFALVQAGRINVDGLISHTFKWQEGPEAFRQIQADRTQFMAVRYDWRDCPA
jgi:threonine dehydrogenase-like Zn-dependent dehydrogenase